MAIDDQIKDEKQTKAKKPIEAIKDDKKTTR